jgi:hypothetical protein
MTQSRFTQAAVEGVVSATPESRFSQAAVEGVVLPTPASRFSQAAVEGVVLPTPPSRFSQAVVEVLISSSARSRFSQAAVEVLLPNSVPVDMAGLTGQLWPRGGDNLPAVTPLTGTTTFAGDVSGLYNALSVDKLKGVPMVGTLGSGQVWSKDPSNAQLIPTSPGAPTNTFKLWDPHYDSNSPNANSDEFDSGTSMPGGTYTAVSLGTSTHDVNVTMPGALVIAPQVSAGWRGWARALPAGDFTITACVTVLTVAANFTLGGVMLSVGAGTGTNHLAYCGWNSRPTLIAETGSNWDSSGVSVRHNWSDIGGHQRIIIRLRRSGTTLYTGWSTNGRVFSEASVTDSSAYAYFGPAFYNTNGAGLSLIVFEYLRYSGSATTVYGAEHTVYRQ